MPQNILIYSIIITTLTIINMQPNAATALENQVNIREDNNYLIIESNSIPNHTIGNFPNRGNPNSVRAQNFIFKINKVPQLANKTTELRHQLFGVALNGVVFDPGTAEFWNNDRYSGWNYEALSGKIPLGLDHNNAHVQPNGTYHYHGIPSSYISSNKNQHPKLMGYAADGFPIYAIYGYKNPDDAKTKIIKVKPSYKLKQGNRPSGPGGKYDGTFVQDYEFLKGMGDLDECNGRFGITPEYPNGIYHYFLTESYPFIPRCFKGTPDKSFQTKMPPRRRQGMNSENLPPHHHRGQRPPHPPHHLRGF